MVMLLIGTALGLVSAIIGALVQHLLSLRAKKIERVG
jgi:biopolymer transport protein ExbB/TolQ